MTLTFNVGGKNLYRYCKDNGYSYNRLRERISDKGMSSEEALKEYLSFKYDKKLKCKYSVNDIPLSKWCKIHKYSYSAIVQRVNKYKISVDEAINMEYNYRMKHPDVE